GHKLVHRALVYFPPGVSEIMESVHVIINRKFGGYLRGQIMLAAIYGALTYIIILLFGIPYPLFIGVFAAVMMLVPFIGTFLAIIPALLGYVIVHATDQSFPLLGLVLLLLVLGAVQHLVINVMAPRVMGSAMDMHPLQVMLGLLLGAQVAGLWGAIFGVPVFGVILDSLDLVYRRVMERRYGFHPPTGAQLDAPDAPPVADAHPHETRRHADPRHAPGPAAPREAAGSTRYEPGLFPPSPSSRHADADPPSSTPQHEREMTTISR
ncbi:MAG TPA: AI-2E family transporter, partial [Chloroflexota bacterium]|nr:AI-2E family transporter [Chloroflexota bacterium]